MRLRRIRYHNRRPVRGTVAWDTPRVGRGGGYVAGFTFNSPVWTSSAVKS
jgi:hypothetical protein